jgi:hypothetical protein
MLWGLAKPKVERSQLVIGTLKGSGFELLKPDFESIYAHALVEYATDVEIGQNQAKRLWVEFFSLKEVSTCIKEHILTGKPEELLYKALDNLLNTRQSDLFLELKIKNVQIESIWNEYELIKKQYDKYAQLSQSSAQAQNTQLSQTILEEIKIIQNQLISLKAQDSETVKISFASEEILLKINQLNEFNQANADKMDLILAKLKAGNQPIMQQFADKIYNINNANDATFKAEIQHINIENQTIIKEVHKIPRNLTNYSSPQTFVGREAEIAEMKAILDNERTVVLVNGLGGIGKTSLAKEYLKRYNADYQYIAWLEQTSTLTNAFILDDLLHQNLGLKFSNEEESVKFKTILNSLKNLQGTNILVIDNYAETSEDLALNPLATLPFADNWKILITSREKIAKFKPLILDTLSEAEAMTLFRTYCSKAVKDEELKILLQTIGYHTLTIELLAKNYALSWDLNSLAELTERLQGNALDAQELQEKVFTEHSQAEIQLFSYLKRIFDLAQLSEEAGWVLKQFAVLPPLSIDGKTFLEWIGDTAQSYKATLQDLAKKGWLKSADGRNFEMHRLIQTLLVKTQNPTYADCENLVESIIQLLDYQKNEEKAIEKQGIVEYGENLLQKLDFSQAVVQKLRLQNDLALTHKVFGQYEKAKGLLEENTTMTLQYFGSTHPSTLFSQSNLAIVYKELGHYNKAQDLLEKTLANALTNFEVSSFEIITFQTNLGIIYKDLMQHEKALKSLNQALELALADLKDTHPLVVKIQSNLANTYRDLYQFEKARDFLESVLKTDLQNFEATHPTIALHQSNLAAIYLELNQYEKAKELLETSLLSNLQNYGINHQIVAMNQYNLANVYFSLGCQAAKNENLALAIDYFENCLNLKYLAFQICQANLGNNHPQTLKFKENLDYIKKMMGLE